MCPIHSSAYSGKIIMSLNGQHFMSGHCMGIFFITEILNTDGSSSSTCKLAPPARGLTNLFIFRLSFVAVIRLQLCWSTVLKSFSQPNQLQYSFCFFLFFKHGLLIVLVPSSELLSHGGHKQTNTSCQEERRQTQIHIHISVI